MIARSLGAAVFLLTAMSGCSSLDAAATTERVRFFHAAYNDGRFGAITAMTSPAFRAAAAKQGAETFIVKVREKLGRVVNSKQITWRVNYTTRGSSTLIQNSTEFERGKGQETFVFVEQDGRPVINGYNIASTDLL